jgi:hypothetical protein
VIPTKATVSISASGTVEEAKADELRAKFHTFTSELSAAGVTGSSMFNVEADAPPPPVGTKVEEQQQAG